MNTNRLLSKTERQSTLRLRDSFNDPSILQRNPELMEFFANSLTVQNIQALDNFITEDLSNHLFQVSIPFYLNNIWYQSHILSLCNFSSTR